MADQKPNQIKQEIAFQIRMLNNLKRWMRNLILLSCVGVAVVYWALAIHEGKVFTIIGVISIIFVSICMILCAIVGLGYKRGEANLSKLQ